MSEQTIQTPNGTEAEEGKGTVQTPPTPAPVVPATPTPPAIDYEKKFSASTTENQRLMGNLKELERQLGDITKVEIPTDQEMSRMFAQWDTLDDFQKDLAKKQVVLEHRQNNIQVGLRKITSNVERTNQVNDFIKAMPSLATKQSEFLEYALDPAHTEIALPILLNSFLFEHPIAPPTPTPPPAPAPSPLQRGTPSGGGTPPTDATTMTDDEEAALMKSNPKLYQEMVRNGRIK